MTRQKSPLIAVIVVLYNSRRHLPALVGSLQAQTYTNTKYYFFDNNSQDDGLNFAAEQMPQAVTIESRENIGYAAANNHAARIAREAGADFLFFLNPDTELDPDCIRELVALFDKEKNTGIAQPALLYGGRKKSKRIIQYFGSTIDFKTRKSTWHYAGSSLDDQVPERIQVDQVSGAVMFIKSDVFFEIGGFDERYFLYGEEIDLAYRAKKQGIKSLVTSRASAWHNHDWSARNITGNRIMYFYKTRNRYLYFRKFGQWKNMIKYVFKDIIYFPLKIVWALKKKDIKLLKYYYLGVRYGILNRTGKANVSFGDEFD